MIALLDVNVLISLLDPDHPGHLSATAWMQQHHTQGWATCPLTENGCVRIMSSAGYANALPLEDVVERLAEATCSPFHSFWPDSVSLLEPSCISASSIRGPKQITDLYLLALAAANGGCFVTRDTAIPLLAVPHAKPENLRVI